MPGEPFTIDVLLDAKQEVDVDAVNVVVVGSVWAQQAHHEVLRLGARPKAPQPLPSGTTSLPVSAVLPAHVPPTYRGSGLRVEWEIDVHASVPWWPDARERFVLIVGAAPSTEPPATTTLFATHEGGPRSEEPYAELSLATRTVAPRGVLRGALAVYGTASHRYTKASLTLRAIEGGVLRANWMGPGWTISVPLGNAIDGQSIPFAIGVPDLVPGFSTPYARLSWSLSVEITTMWSRALAFDVPMFVAAAGSTGTQTAEAYPPLGEERIRRLWTAVGEREGLVLDGDALVGTVGGVRLAIHRGRGAKNRAELVATLGHESLGLDLVVSPRSLGSRLLGRGARSGVEAFDAAHEILARSSAQASAWVAPLAQAILALGLRPGAMSDTSTVVTYTDAGTSERPLGELVRAAGRLARALDAALPTCPLPPGLEPHEVALREAAATLGATVSRGNGRIEGHRDGSRVELTTIFAEAGEANGLRIDVTPESGIRVAMAVVFTRDDEPPTDWPADARRVARGIGASSLSVDTGHVVALLEPPSVALADAVERILRTIDGCLDLVRALRSADGPFR